MKVRWINRAEQTMLRRCGLPDRFNASTRADVRHRAVPSEGKGRPFESGRMRQRNQIVKGFGEAANFSLGNT
jgi:hypothetical protein